MRMILFVVLCFTAPLSFSQILVGKRDSMLLVRDTLNNTVLSNLVFSYCDCLRDHTPHDWADEEQNTMMVPIIYPGGLMILRSQTGYWGIMNTKGEIVLPFKQSFQPSILGNGHYTLTTSEYSYSDGMYYRTGVYDKNDSVVVWLSLILSSYNGSILARDESGRVGILDSLVSNVLPFEYLPASWDTKNFEFTQNGSVSLRDQNGYCGVVNYLGEIIVPFEYDYIEDLHEPENMVKKNGLWGTVDEHGQLIVATDYEELDYDFRKSSWSFCKKDGDWMIVDSMLKPLSDHKYLDVITPTVTKYTASGSVSAPSKYSLIREKSEKWGLFDCASMVFRIEPIYDTLFIQDSVFAAADEKTVSFFDEDGVLVSSLAVSEMDLLNHLNEEFYVYGERFPRDGIKANQRVYLAQKDNKMGLIFHDGKIALPFEFDSIRLQEDYFIVSQNNLWGLIKSNGDTLVDIRFDEILIVNGYIFASTNNQWGVMSMDGVIIVPFEFDEICNQVAYYTDKADIFFSILIARKSKQVFFWSTEDSVLVNTQKIKKAKPLCEQIE